jgi:hypothetical protein
MKHSGIHFLAAWCRLQAVQDYQQTLEAQDLLSPAELATASDLISVGSLQLLLRSQ